MKQVLSLVQFLREDVWRIRAGQLSRLHSFAVTQLRMLLLALRGFAEDSCQLRASALTFYSLLSIVPIVAMAFGIAKGFGFEKMLEGVLYENLQGHEEVVERIILFAQTMLNNTKGGLIAGIGVAVLLWSVLKVLGNIESSFNYIWGIKRSRTLIRKFSDYLSIMFVCPVLLIMSSSATVLITSQVAAVTERVTLLGAVSPAIFGMLKLLPFCVIWAVFTFIYLFMPNTKVHFRSASVGGVIGGTLFQLLQWAYINFQIGVTQYGAIYGSFAALPLFLAWLQLSWLIVLFGAEVAFADQHVATFEFEPDAARASRRFKKSLALLMTHLCVRRFARGEQPISADQITRDIEVPIRLVHEVLHDLVESRILSEVSVQNGSQPRYQPARGIDSLTIEGVLELLDRRGSEAIPISNSRELSKIRESLAAFDTVLRGSAANVLLRDL